MLNKTTRQIIELQLIRQILNPSNLDVDVIHLIINLHNKINKSENPIFSISGVPVMQYWQEFRKFGLMPFDYVYYNFYIRGLPDNKRFLPQPINLEINNVEFVDLETEKIISILSNILSEMDEYMDVYLCKAIGDLYYGINKYDWEDYNFVENGKSVMDYWDDFIYRSLSPICYIEFDYYKKEKYQKNGNNKNTTI